MPTNKLLTRRILLTVATIMVIGIVAIAVPRQTTHAISGTDWQAGNIISDSIFYDNSSMSATDIQGFMNNKVPNCDTNGTQIYPGTSMTNAQYAASRGWPAPPYTCLRNYYQVPRSDQNINNFQGRSVPSGAMSAAQIIKYAADSYGINPKVLLTTLQKESPGPLLTDSWPLDSQYRNAMGYGCPDTAPCDPTYEGFYNQMMNAAWQFKQYKTNPNAYRKVPFQWNDILYNPNSACSSSAIYIQNYATAGLYNYTPYQPNQAALNNLYGTGDGCSAYGNRNFWRMFNDWFESDFLWQYVSQTNYTDSTQTTIADSNALIANQPQRQYITIKVKNIGLKTWTKGSIYLGTSQPQNRSSQLYDSTWSAQDRPATLNESSVAPGEYGSFSFWVNTPRSAGSYKEYFNLLVEGSAWMNDIGLNVSFNVQPASYTWSLVSQQSYTDSTKQTPASINNMIVGDTAYMSIKVQNTGNTTWIRNGVNIGTASPYGRASSLETNSWLGSGRPTTLQEPSVAPGGVGTFEFPIRVSTAGNYKEYFNIVAENIAWMNDIGLYYQYNVSSPQYAWQLAAQAAYTDATKTTPVDLSQLYPGQNVYLEVKAKNIGNTNWQSSQLHLGTTGPNDRSSSYYDTRWLSYNRPAGMSEALVAPGQTGTFGFWIKAPSATGTQKEYFNFVNENVSWLNDIGLYYQFTVH